MRKSLLKSLLSATMLIAGVSASAYDFKVGDVFYSITSSTDNTVAVACETSTNGGYSGDVVIPASVTNDDVTYAVTSVGARAFYNCSGMTSVSLPATITSFGNYAFYACSGLKSVTIPESVTSIGTYTFAYCSSLETLTLPESVTTIPNYFCQLCTGLKSFVVSNKVTSIGNYAFRECLALESITIGTSVTKLGSNALFGCGKLTTVNIPASVTSIGNNAFGMNDNLTEITVDDANTAYASVDGVLYNKDITQVVVCPGAKTAVTIPETVTAIPNYAFRECGLLKTVVIPNGVTSIGQYAFRECSSLTTVTLGSSLATLSTNSFYGCTALSTIYCMGETPATGRDTSFPSSAYTSATLYVPNGTSSAYKAVVPWSSFTTIMDMTSGVEAVDASALKVVATGNVIAVNGTDDAEIVEVYNVGGLLLYHGTDTAIEMPTSGVYLVKVSGKTFKVAL